MLWLLAAAAYCGGGKAAEVAVAVMGQEVVVVALWLSYCAGATRIRDTAEQQIHRDHHGDRTRRDHDKYERIDGELTVYVHRAAAAASRVTCPSSLQATGVKGESEESTMRQNVSSILTRLTYRA
nr:unnamed protein product [Digitaria exilis]CAB3455586.1 unnamed protein product [Digitaria exilis]